MLALDGLARAGGGQEIVSWNYYGGSKYKAKKVEVDGIKFDSKREARRYEELLILEQAGEIKDLKRQVKYILIPAQREPDSVGARGGRIKGKLIERECAYVADFVYTDTATGELIVEDVKGMRTSEYIVKRKLMLWVNNIRIKEV